MYPIYVFLQSLPKEFFLGSKNGLVNCSDNSCSTHTVVDHLSWIFSKLFWQTLYVPTWSKKLYERLINLSHNCFGQQGIFGHQKNFQRDHNYKMEVAPVLTTDNDSKLGRLRSLTGKSCAGRSGVLVPIVLLEARKLVRDEGCWKEERGGVSASESFEGATKGKNWFRFRLHCLKDYRVV